MTHNNPYNLLPLQPTGRNETNTANTYSPEDMIKIYEQQYLTQVSDEELKEFTPFLKDFYGIDDNMLAICSIVFEHNADFCIIYNHKVKVGAYKILQGLVFEDIENADDTENEESPQAYTLECRRLFYINDVELPYHFNLFMCGDEYSTLTRTNTLLEKIYWFVQEGFDDTILLNADEQESLESINEALADLGIREMDLGTIHEIIKYVEDSIIDDKMAQAVNILVDNAERLEK